MHVLSNVPCKLCGSAAHGNLASSSSKVLHTRLGTAICALYDIVAIDSRFPENELMEWTVFDIIALSNSVAFDSGEKEIVKLFNRNRCFFEDADKAREETVPQYHDLDSSF